MKFGNINYFAVLVAAAVAWLAGAAWYRAFARAWVAAQGMTPESVHAARHEHGAYLPFIVAFLAELVMAWTLAGILFHVGAITVRRGIIAGALCWFGFVLTTMLVNNTFERRDRRLLLIDAGHWLLAFLLIGAILGALPP
jgi:Protein of unknown function (DUF1761)